MNRIYMSVTEWRDEGTQTQLGTPQYILYAHYLLQSTCISLQTLGDYVNRSRFLGVSLRFGLLGFSLERLNWVITYYKVLDVECN